MLQRFNFFKKKDLRSCEYNDIHRALKVYRKREIILSIMIVFILILISYSVYVNIMILHYGVLGNIIILSALFMLFLLAGTIFLVFYQNFSPNLSDEVSFIYNFMKDNNIKPININMIEQISSSNSSAMSIQTLIPVVALPIIASMVNYIIPLSGGVLAILVIFVSLLLIGFMKYYDDAIVDTLIKEAIIRLRADRDIEKARILALADESRLRRLLETVPRK